MLLVKLMKFYLVGKPLDKKGIFFMLKSEKEYEEKYGDIPLNEEERLQILINRLNKTKRKKKKNIFDEIKRIESITWSTYSFTMYLVPKATPRPRANTLTGIFYVVGASNNKKMFQKYFKEHPHEMIHTPMYFNVDVYFPTPSSMNLEEKILAEKRLIRPISKPDFDNVAKTYADMLTGSLIYDDALIIDGRCNKFYSIKPRIEITITYMDEFDSLFNRKKIESQLNRKGD